MWGWRRTIDRYDRDETDAGYSDDGRDNKDDAAKIYPTHGRPVARGAAPTREGAEEKPQRARGRIEGVNCCM